MLRVPMESHMITLCRAGRSTCYPANFQLIMATNPCPCGNYGAKEKICLCSAKSVQQYWNKVSGPLLDRIQIMVLIQDDEETETVNLVELKEHIRTAFEIQRKNGAYPGRVCAVWKKSPGHCRSPQSQYR